MNRPTKLRYCDGKYDISSHNFYNLVMDLVISNICATIYILSSLIVYQDDLCKILPFKFMYHSFPPTVLLDLLRLYC